MILAAVIVVIVISAISVVLATSVLSPQKNPAQSNVSSSPSGSASTSTSWIQKGAYATYQGNTSVLGFNIGFTAQLEIIDLNSTHIEIQTDFNMSTPYGSNSNSTTQWVNRDNMTYQPQGLTLNSTSTAQVNIPGLGTTTCTVYSYSSQDISATYYVDDKIQWPVKIVMNSPTVQGQSYSMNISLVKTNIPGL